MGLQLFHVTEFAQSEWVSPEAQREASHPLAIIVLAGFWLAVPGNFALWHVLLSPHGNITALTWPLVVTLALLLTCAIGLLLSLMNWRWTLKLTITALLLLAAFNTHVLLTQASLVDVHQLHRMVQDPAVELRSLLDWKLIPTVLLLAFVPAVWLWRRPIRRSPLLPRLKQNLGLGLLFGALLLGLWLVNRHELSALVQSQPQLSVLLHPLHAIQGLAQALMGQTQGV